MKSKVGVVCIVLGVLLLAGAGALGLYNMIQDMAARDAAAAAMSQLVEQLQENTANEPTIPEDAIVPGLELQIPVDLLTDEDKKMAEVKIDGYNYIGYLSIPALELELPIMSSWSHRQLKIAPCRYSGSLRGEDLVLMAHNYSRHFGKISKLNEGDAISFTDVDGVVTHYQVAAMDILEPTAVEVMTSGEFDLTLFTCTYGGGSRVTVYCNKE
jgi:sortase A